MFQRVHPDPYADPSAPLTTDRQRVVRSSAFRRLQHKTQVFVAHEGDHFRTRLTHTLEVADLARQIAGALGLQAELAEVIALAHDLGHPPFGHAGERALDERLKSEGGFEHNAHSLRVVEYLEHPYPEFRGLNLTTAVCESLAKHSTRFDHPGGHPLQDGRPPLLEGLVAATADRLAYGLHDLQDGLYAGLLDISAVKRLELWNLCAREDVGTNASEWRRGLRPIVDRMQAALVADAVNEARRQVAALGFESLPAAQRAPGVTLCPGAAMEPRLKELEDLLYEDLYRHPRLARMDSKARRVLTAVLDAYIAEPALLPSRYQVRVESQGATRVAADYVAGMTDRFCLEEHARLFDPRIEV